MNDGAVLEEVEDILVLSGFRDDVVQKELKDMPVTSLWEMLYQFCEARLRAEELGLTSEALAIVTLPPLNDVGMVREWFLNHLHSVVYELEKDGIGITEA